MNFQENIEKAKSEVGFAYESVPFFKDHMDRSNLRPNDIKSFHDFLDIPFTQKKHYRSNFPHGVLARGKTLDEPFLTRIQSSGTEGDRLTSVNYQFTLAQRMSTVLKMNDDFQYLFERDKIRTCRYAAPNCSDVECANPNSKMEDRLLEDNTLVLPVYHDLLTTPDTMLERAFSEITTYKPDMFYVDPVHMSRLISYLRSKNIHSVGLPEKHGVLMSYTLPTLGHRQVIQDFFGNGTPVASVIAMSEFGYVGMECHEGNMHLNSEDYYLELLVDGRPANSGELAELYVTTIGDKLSPKIRYKTGDLYRLKDGKCSCGSDHPIVIPEGREKNLLMSTSGNEITPNMIDNLVGKRDWIDLYQVTHVGDHRYVIRFIGNGSHSDQDLRMLNEQLSNMFDSSKVQIQKTEYLPSERGGKFMFVKS